MAISSFQTVRESLIEQPVPASAPVARKGRGAVSNLQGRYEVNGRERFDDGWEHDLDDAGAVRTVVTDEVAKTILSRNTSPDIPFSVSLNPYHGCEHVNRDATMRV